MSALPVPQPRAAHRAARASRRSAAEDQRVTMVREVLAGQPVPAVARRWKVEPEVLRRWVDAFVAAGTAQVTNRPEPTRAQERDRFLAAFAHELRTPLAVATGWADLLEDDVPPEQLGPAVQRVRRALGQLAESTREAELLAAASLGRLRTSPQPTRVGALVEGLDGLTRVGGLGRAAELCVDTDLFRRVLRDLWRAAHQSPAPTDVRLDVRVVGPWWELRVVREAAPLEHAVLRALLDPFGENDDTTGVTTGLHLARALTVAHGGTIGVEQDDCSTHLLVRVPRRPATVQDHDDPPTGRGR